MRARLYANGQLVADVELVGPRGGPDPRIGDRVELAVNDRVVVAIVEEHPSPGAVPLFLEGRLERAS